MASSTGVTDVDADGLRMPSSGETNTVGQDLVAATIRFSEKVRDRPADAGSLRNGLRPGAHFPSHPAPLPRKHSRSRRSRRRQGRAGKLDSRMRT